MPLVRQYLLIQTYFAVPLALVNILRFMIQGMGFSPIATLAGVLEMVGRGSMAYLTPLLGYMAACFAAPAAWLLADVFLITAYFLCCRHLRRTAPLLAAVQ